MDTATLDNAEVELLWAMTKAVELKIVVKSIFSEKGKTMEELLTDVMLEKGKADNRIKLVQL